MVDIPVNVLGDHIELAVRGADIEHAGHRSAIRRRALKILHPVRHRDGGCGAKGVELSTQCRETEGLSGRKCRKGGETLRALDVPAARYLDVLASPQRAGNACDSVTPSVNTKFEVRHEN